MALDVSPSTVETSTYLQSCEAKFLSTYKDLSSYIILLTFDGLLDTKMWIYPGIKAYCCNRRLMNHTKRICEYIVISSCIQPPKWCLPQGCAHPGATCWAHISVFVPQHCRLPWFVKMDITLLQFAGQNINCGTYPLPGPKPLTAPSSPQATSICKLQAQILKLIRVNYKIS